MTTGQTKKLVIGNLKMNILSPIERGRYLKDFSKAMAGKKLTTVMAVLCPPFVHLEQFRKSIKRQDVQIGAQNMFLLERGSFTGEVSAPMLKSIGTEFVILGHSERRRYFGEDEAVVNAKLKMALKCGLAPVVCIGDTHEQRDSGDMKRILRMQIEGALEGVPGGKLEQIVLVYEPVWAVGTDILPTSNEVLEAKILVKKILTDLYGAKRTGIVRILYGGSVSARVAKQVCLDPAMDGVLVGRESLIPREFLKIAEIING
ncbi:triose-phosphate isomerase [Patescibacteria group bacterium]|nr:MAG: triose-phosphate isomerase [Patescibacteria group bacterium]